MGRCVTYLRNVVKPRDMAQYSLKTLVNIKDLVICQGNKVKMGDNRTCGQSIVQFRLTPSQ